MDKIITTEFWDVVLTWWDDIWYASENKNIKFIGQKAKRVSDWAICLISLVVKPKDYKYDIVFY